MTVFAILYAVLIIGGLVFWVWALLDCLSRKDQDFPSKGTNDKLIWTLVIIFANVLGALIYLFLVKFHSRQHTDS